MQGVHLCTRGTHHTGGIKPFFLPLAAFRDYNDLKQLQRRVAALVKMRMLMLLSLRRSAARCEYMHKYVHTYAYLYTCIHINMYIYLFLSLRLEVHVHSCVRVYIFKNEFVMCACVHNVHAYIQMDIYMHICTYI